MFERFTERARQVVVFAQDESRGLGHDYIGTEHLLLGLLRVEESLASRVLVDLGVTLEAVRPAVEETVGRGEQSTIGQIPFTPRAKKALELALREALSFGHNHIGAEHVLLGLARDPNGAAMRILGGFDLDLERIRLAVIDRLPEKKARRRDLPRTRRPWEYLVVEIELTAERLNEVAIEGWELVTVTPDGRAVFKRRG